MDSKNDKNSASSTNTRIIPNLEDDLEMVDEIEEYFYSYCKTIVLNVIEPVLLGLCERPNFQAQNLTQGKTLDTQNILFATGLLQNSPDPDTCIFPLENLVGELKGLSNDLRSILTLHECLMTQCSTNLKKGQNNEISKKVSDSLKEIRRTAFKIQNGSLEDEPLCNRLLTDLSSSFQEINAFLKEIDKCKIKNCSSKDSLLSYRKKFDCLSGNKEEFENLLSAERSLNIEQDTQVTPQRKLDKIMYCSDFKTSQTIVDNGSRFENLPEISAKNLIKREHIPVEVSVSSLFETSCISTEDETFGSSIQSNETSRSSSCGNLDAKLHNDAFESRPLQPARLEVVKDLESRQIILTKVNSRYLRKVQDHLHGSLCKSNEDCKCRKQISSCTPTEVEQIKLAYKDELERILMELLAGIFKNVDIKDIFEHKDLSNCSFNTGKKNDTNSCRSETVSNHLQSSLNDKFSSYLKSHPIAVTSYSGTESAPLSAKINPTADENFQINPQDLKSRRYEHIFNIIKVLRSILIVLKGERVNMKSDISKNAPNRDKRENLKGNNFEYESSFSIKNSRTLMDILLDELFKKIILKKFEQKIQNETEFLSDESLNMLLFDLNESGGTTSASFSDDAFEEFKSRTPSVVNDDCLLTEEWEMPEKLKVEILGAQSTKDEDTNQILPKTRSETQAVTQERLAEKSSVSGCRGATQNSECSFSNKNDIFEIHRHRVLEQRISDICLQLKSNKSSPSSIIKNLKIKKNGDETDEMSDCIKKMLNNLSQNSEEQVSKRNLRPTRLYGQKSASFLLSEKENAEPKTCAKETKNTRTTQSESHSFTNGNNIFMKPDSHNIGTELMREIQIEVKNAGTGNTGTKQSEIQDYETGNIDLTQTGTYITDNENLVGTQSKILTTESKQQEIPNQNDAEEEIDFNESMRSLGQQITDIEEYQNDFQSVEKLQLVANEIQKSSEVTNNGGLEYTNHKVEAPGKYNRSTVNVPEKLHQESLILLEDRYPQVIKTLNQSDDSRRISHPNLVSMSSPLSLNNSSECSTEADDFDYTSFTTADNILLGAELPVNTVCCAQVTTPVLSSVNKLKNPGVSKVIGTENKFRFADGTPKISCSKSAQHLVFTKSEASKLIEEEENALAVDMSTIVKTLRDRDSRDFEVTVSQTSDVDVEFSKSEIKLFALKSKLVNAISDENACKMSVSHSAEMLVPKPCLKSSKFRSIIKNETLRSINISKDSAEKSKFLETLCSIVSKIKVKSSEPKKITEGVPKLSENSTGSINISKVKKRKNSKGTVVRSENHSNQDKRQVLKSLTIALASDNLDSENSLNFCKMQTDSKSFMLPEKNVEKTPHRLSLMGTSFETKQSQEPTDNTAHTKKTDILIKSSRNKKEGSQTKPVKLMLDNCNNVLSASSFSMLSDGFQYSRSPSETSINEQLILASSSSLHDEKTMTSVLALEPTDNNNTMRFEKSVEKSEALDNRHDFLKTSVAPKSHERTLRSTFNLINSCEKILSCKRRSDELRSRSFNRGRNSLVTVLKNADEKFVNKTSSYGPAVLCKNIASQTSYADPTFNGESSEVEERSTCYDQHESREALKHDKFKEEVNLPESQETATMEDLSLRTIPWFGTPETVVANTVEEFHDIEISQNVECGTGSSLHSNGTSYYSSCSEVFYDLPIIESDIAYHLEIERNFNLSCAKIESSSSNACARVSPIDTVKRKSRNREENNEKLERNLVPSCIEKERPRCTDDVECGRNNKMASKKAKSHGANCHYINKKHKKKDLVVGKQDDKHKSSSRQDPINESSVKRCSTLIKKESKDAKRSAKVSHKADIRKESDTAKDNFDFNSGRKQDKDNLKRREDFFCREPPRCLRDNCRIQHRRHDEVLRQTQESFATNFSCKKANKMKPRSNVKPVQRQLSFEKQLSVLNDSLKASVKICHQNQDSPKLARTGQEPQCFRPFCTKSRHPDDIICRSRFTGRRREEMDFFSLESSVESEISRRTFHSDGEKFLANSDIVMEFFERVYGVYDHIRQCASCKALMGQIIGEVITDLATMRRKA